MQGVSIINNQIWLSYSYLKQHGITDKQLENWSVRGKSQKRKIGGEVHVLYESTSKDAKDLLPAPDIIIAEYHVKQLNDTVAAIKTRLENAIKSPDIAPILNRLREQYPDLKPEKGVEFAKTELLWQCIIGLKGFSNQHIYEAVNSLYPDKYTYSTFQKNKSLAQRNGAGIVAFDSRALQAGENARKIDDALEHAIRAIVSDGRARSGRAEHRDLVAYCKQFGIHPLALRTYQLRKAQLLKGNISVYESRRGKKQASDKLLSYASIEHASSRYVQYQMDGYEPPVHIKTPDGKFRTWVLVIVMDAHSKKIVGFAYGETENTITIMNALKNAIGKEQCLPVELVTDNHSYNQTKEAEFFKKETAKFGMTYHVTSNPQEKTIIEGHNRHLNAHFREFYGYTAEGIKSRNRDASVNPKIKGELLKNPVTAEEFKGMCAAVVAKFNSTVLEKYGKSPNQMFDESTPERGIKLTIEDQVRILTAKTELKVERNQINIKRGGVKHEFAFLSEHHKDCNDKKVWVRYEDLTQGIYVYEKDTDRFITDLKPKQRMHGAQYDQKEDDKQGYFKDSGISKGIYDKAEKSNIELTKKVYEKYPERLSFLEGLLIPKTAKQAIEGDEYARQLAIEAGIDLNKIPDRKVKAYIDKTLLPQPKKAPKHTIKAKGDCSVFNAATDKDIKRDDD